eukprot:114286-Chlamydomonas_euryale.AAC.4
MPSNIRVTTVAELAWEFLHVVLTRSCEMCGIAGNNCLKGRTYARQTTAPVNASVYGWQVQGTHGTHGNLPLRGVSSLGAELCTALLCRAHVRMLTDQSRSCNSSTGTAVSDGLRAEDADRRW